MRSFKTRCLKTVSLSPCLKSVTTKTQVSWKTGYSWCLKYSRNRTTPNTWSNWLIVSYSTQNLLISKSMTLSCLWLKMIFLWSLMRLFMGQLWVRFRITSCGTFHSLSFTLSRTALSMPIKIARRVSLSYLKLLKGTS